MQVTPVILAKIVCVLIGFIMNWFTIIENDNQL